MSDYVIDYVVIKTDSLGLLEKQVKELCSKGWSPTGGVCYSPYYSGTSEKFYQAMVKTR